MNFEYLELELTTNCNAACPQCTRNFYGGPTWPRLPITSLSLDWLKEKLPEKFLKELTLIRLCGTFGDPCVHPDMIEIVKWFKSITNAKIAISTNGGMRSTKWWAELATVLSGPDVVIFGIDGLEDTNHLYRRNVSWDRLMKNVQAFNSAGGKSEWQFIVFEHNQHQVKEAEQLSQKIGVTNFYIKKTVRFVNKKHELIDETPVMDNKKIYFIKPPTDKDLLNEGYSDFNKSDYKSLEIACMAKHLKMLYIAADGYVFPCGYLADRMYGYEAENHADYKRLYNLFDLAGGPDKANLNSTLLNDIINGAWFNVIEDSWKNENRLERCAFACKKDNKLVTNVDTTLLTRSI